MAITTADVTRVFKFKKGSDTLTLDDPNSSLSPEEVLSMYTNAHPELTTATVSGPKVEDENIVYEFTTTIGTKG